MRQRVVVLLVSALCFPLAAAAGSSCDAGQPSEQRAQLLGDAALTEVQQCAEQGDVVALNEMGRRYGLGLEVPVDAGKSFEFYERAAVTGYAQAKANLAYMYFNGEGTAKDYDKALRLYTEAAEAGLAQAQYALGYSYSTGIGAAINAVLAEKYYVAAAEQGYVPAQQALVTFYTNGKLIPVNYVLSAVWLKRVGRVSYLMRPWRKGDAD